jgi:hypothetical protein
MTDILQMITDHMYRYVSLHAELWRNSTGEYVDESTIFHAEMLLAYSKKLEEYITFMGIEEITFK